MQAVYQNMVYVYIQRSAPGVEPRAPERRLSSKGRVRQSDKSLRRLLAGRPWMLLEQGVHGDVLQLGGRRLLNIHIVPARDSLGVVKQSSPERALLCVGPCQFDTPNNTVVPEDFGGIPADRDRSCHPDVIGAE